MVTELIDHSTHSWDVSKLRNCLHPISAIEALKTPICSSDPSDHLFWPLTKDGLYSVSFGYKCLLHAFTPKKGPPSSSYVNSEASWNAIWGSKFRGRVTHFIWRLKHNALAIKKICLLGRLQWTLCAQFVKLRRRLWSTCYSYVFGLPLFGCVCNSVRSLQDIICQICVWFATLLEYMEAFGGNANDMLGIILMGLWNIWKAKNDCVSTYQSQPW